MSDKKKEKMFLDITMDSCPITFVKTKIALEKLKVGQSLEVHISAGEALDGLPESLKELSEIPGFVRGKVKRNTEKFASTEGINEITLEVMYKAKEAANIN